MTTLHTSATDGGRIRVAGRLRGFVSWMAPLDSVYRPFFIAAIIAGLTAGAAWGVWLLVEIGRTGSFTGVSIHTVNAHGHAQIFGWIGLFVMGFAYHVLPRLWRSAPVAPAQAGASFLLMIGGLTLCVIGTALATRWGAAPTVAAAGGGLMFGATLVLFFSLLGVFRRSEALPAPWVAFVFVGLAFFALSTLYNAWHVWMTTAAPNREALLYAVSTHQGALRNLQMHGFALFMILGMSMRLIPPLFGARLTPDRPAWIALWLLLAAVVVETGAFLAFQWTGSRIMAGGMWMAWLLLPIGVGLVALPWRLWAPLPLGGRASKFVRAAYIWLAVALAMLIAFPLYQFMSGQAFSHAYYGGVRHAYTVGFMSMMIMGMAAKVVPTFRRVDERALTNLWGPFLLVTIGCALRVTLQIATDWRDSAFWIVPVSGVMELTGLAWWGAHLASLMLRDPDRRRGGDIALPIADQTAAAASPGSGRENAGDRP